MYIYHYTDIDNKESIVKNGLLIESAKNALARKYDTEPINQLLNQYRPNHLPAFVNRDRCIFLSPNQVQTYRLDEWFRENNIEVIVPVDCLNISKLFAFNADDAQKIWCEIIDAPYSGEHIDEPLDIVAKRYWRNGIPFKDYLIKKKTIDYAVELLYFDDISPERIAIA